MSEYESEAPAVRNLCRQMGIMVMTNGVSRDISRNNNAAATPLDVYSALPFSTKIRQLRRHRKNTEVAANG